MGRYCVITRDHKEFVIIEKKRLSYLNDEKLMVPVTDDINIDKYNGSLFLVHGEYIQSGLEMVDSDDEIAPLKTRYPGKEKRVRVFKHTPFSPGNRIQSTQKKITTEIEKKTYVKNPAAHISVPRKTVPSRASAKDSKIDKSVASGGYYRSFFPPSNSKNNEDDVEPPQYRLNETESVNAENDIEDDDNECEVDQNENIESDHAENNDGLDDDFEDTPRKTLSDITNITDTSSGAEKIIKRNQSKGLRSITWRRQIENTLTSIKKDIRKCSQVNNLHNFHQTSGEPENEGSSTNCSQIEEKIEVVDDVEITTIGGVSFDAEQYTNVLMASTMKMRAGRVMNVMWTNDQMKKLYISELKAKGEFSKVTTRDISKIKGICRHLQKKHFIPVRPGSTDDINKNIKNWISNKLKEKKRGPKCARPRQN
ncbi:uncharacterized protein LOC141534614 [Cotesia typhae]|uniref:uncharacterized protein LOC141534614 n=2 Tax=Cotesia typhae TaxID=2053667 RepID=UPI003D690DAB